MTHEAQLARLVQVYQDLKVDTLRTQLATVYAPQVRFKDPFNEVQGIDAVLRIFEHMFVQVDAPRFVVTTAIVQGDDAFLTWDFRFTMKRHSRAPQCIRGATHLRFDAAGLVSMHRDYWDAAEELYEKLPLLGTLMRWLKRAAQS